MPTAWRCSRASRPSSPNAGFAVGNIDVVVIAQRPKLVPYIDAMRANLARAMNIGIDNVSIKGKTNEGVDSMGAGDSIAVHAVALLMGSGVKRTLEMTRRPFDVL